MGSTADAVSRAGNEVYVDTSLRHTYVEQNILSVFM